MKALLIIDLQKDFLPGGSLAVPEGNEVVSLVNELIPEYELVVATQDWHPKEHGSFAANHAESEVGDVIDLNGLQQILWPVHCVQGTQGADFDSELDTQSIDAVFQKGTDITVDSYSGFYDNGRRKATGLHHYLHEKRVKEVHLVGLATDYCVKFTALDALQAGFITVLIADACRGVDLRQGDVERAKQEIEQAGGTVVTSKQIFENE